MSIVPGAAESLSSFQVDSLKKVIIKKAKQKQDISNDLFLLEQHYANEDPIKGINVFIGFLSVESFIKTDKNLTHLYASLAYIYFMLHRHDQAARLYYLSSNYAMKIKEFSIVAWNNISIGNIYFDLGITSKARQKYIQSFNFADSLLNEMQSRQKDSLLYYALNHIKIVSSENIGMCFQMESNFDSAYYYLTKLRTFRLNYKEKVNSQYYYSNLGKLFVLFNKPDSAIKNLNKALSIGNSTLASSLNKAFVQNYLKITLLNLSLAYYQKKQYDSSLYYENQFFKMININKPLLPELNMLTNAIDYYFRNKSYNKCLELINFTKKINKEGAGDIDFRLNLFVSEIYDIQKKYQLASRLKTELLKIMDSTLTFKRIQGIELAEADVNLQAQQDKIKSLEEENKLKQDIITSQKTINTLYIILLFAILIILTGIVITYLGKKKNLETINNKNLELQKLNVSLENAIKVKDEMNIELTATQSELLRINENLETTNQTKNKLFSIIAHDMKNAIGGMRSLNHIINSEYDTMDETERKQIISLITTSTDEMYKLLENLLLWSSSQKGNINPNKEYNRPYYVSNSSIMLYKQVAADKQIKVINNIPEDFSFVFDATLLDTIFRNLLNNAIKYTNEGGQIDIKMEVNDDFVKFSIEDNGVGMSPQKAANIFSNEKMKSTPGTKGEKGTGLGLMVCYDFVKMHNGNIWFESEVGKGTKVFFTFENIQVDV